MWERWGIRGGSPLYQHSLSTLKIQYNKCRMKPSNLCRFNNPNENMSQYVCIYHVVLNYIYWNYGSFPTINKNSLNHTAQEKKYCFTDWLICKYKEKTLKMKRIMLSTPLTLPIQRWEAAQQTSMLSDLHHLFEINVGFVCLFGKWEEKHDTAKIMLGSLWQNQTRITTSYCTNCKTSLLRIPCL